VVAEVLVVSDGLTIYLIGLICRSILFKISGDSVPQTTTTATDCLENRHSVDHYSARLTGSSDRAVRVVQRPVSTGADIHVIVLRVLRSGILVRLRPLYGHVLTINETPGASAAAQTCGSSAAADDEKVGDPSSGDRRAAQSRRRKSVNRVSAGLNRRLRTGDLKCSRLLRNPRSDVGGRVNEPHTFVPIRVY